jgi:hypothetical protein
MIIIESMLYATVYAIVVVRFILLFNCVINKNIRILGCSKVLRQELGIGGKVKVGL